MHAHFDCFSGAAGDMLLAAAIDAASYSFSSQSDSSNHSNNNEDVLEGPSGFLSDLYYRLKHGLPEIAHEWDLHTMKVLRGSGRIAARKVEVESVFQHKSAPVPGTVGQVSDHDYNHSHGHNHSHDHNHSHEHSHEHSHDH